MIGAISGSDRQTRLTFRLIDAETGRHLTAYRSDGALGHDASLDEHLATRIIAAMQPCLRLAEIDRAGRKPPTDLSPHDMALRAMPWVLSLNAEGNAHALDLLERAMERDPDNALATALAAWAYSQRLVYHFTATPNEDRARSAELARKAQTLGGDATVLAVLGNAFTFLHDLEAAELMIRKALSIDGGSAWAWSRSGWLDVYNNDADSGIERLKIALDLAPNDSLAFNSMVGIGCAHFESGRYAEAAHWQQRALAEHPSATWIHRTMCPAYVLVGAQSEARRSVTALREHYPDLTVSEVQKGLPPLPQSYCDRVFDALHSVGFCRSDMYALSVAADSRRRSSSPSPRAAGGRGRNGEVLPQNSLQAVRTHDSQASTLRHPPPSTSPATRKSAMEGGEWEHRNAVPRPCDSIENQHVKSVTAPASRFAPRNDGPGLRRHGNAAGSESLRSAPPAISFDVILPGLIIMNDREQLSALIGDIYDAVFDPDHRTDVLDGSCGLCRRRFGQPAFEACLGQFLG